MITHTTSILKQQCLVVAWLYMLPIPLQPAIGDESISVTFPTSTTRYVHGSDVSVHWNGAPSGGQIIAYLFRDEQYVDVYHPWTDNDGVANRCCFPSSWGVGSNYRVRVEHQSGAFGWSDEFTLLSHAPEGDKWADALASSGSVDNPGYAIGAPDATPATWPDTLAQIWNGGQLTVRFDDNVIVDGPGNDFEVHVLPNSSHERGSVHVSETGSSFVLVATFEDGHESPMLFDIATTGLQEVRYVRIVDDPASDGSNGPDIDAVGAIGWVDQLDDEPGRFDEHEACNHTLSASGSTANKLVLITHGNATSEGSFNDPSGSWQSLAEAIASSTVNSNEWDVATHWWDNSIIPTYSLFLGKRAGACIGYDIASNHQYDFVHLIGHSAGAGFVETAARIIKDENPSIIVHTTFLDAFNPLPFEDYGQWSDWADQYYSGEPLILYALCGILNGEIPTPFFTEVPRPSTTNVDVTAVDSDFSPLCLSSHSWPICFYHSSTGSNTECGNISGMYEPFGFGLSRERFNSDQQWFDAIAAFPVGSHHVLPIGERSQGAQSDDVEILSRIDQAISFGDTEFLIGDSGDVSLTDQTVEISSDMPGSPAWINCEVVFPGLTNVVQADVVADSNGIAEGVLSVYVDGVLIGREDERFVNSEESLVYFNMSQTFSSGPHVVSFRVDTFNAGIAEFEVSNVSTAYYEIVPSCIEDSSSSEPEYPDAAVDIFDLLATLDAWGKCLGDCSLAACPQDVVRDCDVNLFDLLAVLDAWGACD